MSDPALALVMLGVLVFTIMVGFPVAFTMMALGVGFGYYAYFQPGQAFFDNRVFYLLTQNTYGVMTNDTLVSIPLFLFMGYMVERANILDKLFFSLQVAARHLPGALAVAAIVTCALFAIATGIVGDATDALGAFRRFPQWMWRNADVLDFVGWLRAHNESTDPDRRVGFYGLDLYSLHASMDAVLEYLAVVDPDAATAARERYACFDRFGADPVAYGRATTMRLAPNCEREVLAQLVALQRAAGEYARRDGRVAADAQFFAEQNARLVLNAERYYRTMFLSSESSWNLRDRHMADTLSALSDYLSRPGAPARIVVWAHNSHLGDARATAMGNEGEMNLGQFTREAYGRDCVLTGFTTSRGTVTASSDWDSAAERKVVRPALADSYEDVLHRVPVPNFFLDFSRDRSARDALEAERLERAIGVIYRPSTERASHYFRACLPQQFDALFHYDETRAVEPLERTGLWIRGEPPDTYPSAL